MKRVIILKCESPYSWYKDKVNDVIEIDSIDDRGYGIIRKNGVVSSVIEPKDFTEVNKYRYKHSVGAPDFYAHVNPKNPDFLCVHNSLLNKSFYISFPADQAVKINSGGLSFEADFTEIYKKLNEQSKALNIKLNDLARNEMKRAFALSEIDHFWHEIFSESEIDAGKAAAEDLIKNAKESLKTKRTVFGEVPKINPFDAFDPLLKSWDPTKYNFRCNPERWKNEVLPGWVGGMDFAKKGSDKTVIGVFASGPDAGKPIYKGEIKIDGITVSEGEKVGVKNQPEPKNSFSEHGITIALEKFFKLTAHEGDYVYLKASIKESPDLFYHLVKKFIKKKGIDKMEMDLHKAAVTEIKRVSEMPIFSYGYSKTALIDADAIKKSIEHNAIELTYKGHFKKGKKYNENDFVCSNGIYYRCKLKGFICYVNPEKAKHGWENLTGKTYKVKF